MLITKRRDPLVFSILGLVSLDVTAMTAPECFLSSGDGGEDGDTQGTADPNLMFMIKSGFKFFLFPILCITMVGVYKWQLSRMTDHERARRWARALYRTRTGGTVCGAMQNKQYMPVG